MVGAFRRGQHVELAVVLLVSLGAVLASLFGWADDKLITALTVTGIGALGLALLGLRFELTDMVADLRRAAAGARFQQEPPYELPALLAGSSVVVLAGVDLARTFSNYESHLTAFVKAGKELRVMLYDPDGPAVDYAVMRSKRPFLKDRQRGLINDGAADFRQLMAIPQARAEVRFSPAPFPFGVVAADYRTDNGLICLKYYTYRLENYDKPWLRVTAADGRWYRQFGDEVDALWNDARPA
ncbi:hypothetical protein ACTWLT_29490 [Micromonospora sp. ZYX-F-536]